jgi:hypothetical protein
MQIAEKRQIPNKSLSIRVCADGLSFCVYTPSSPEPFEYKVYKVKPTISLAANLKEALMTEPILKENYQRVNVIVSTANFTTVPVVAFKSEDVEDIYNYVFPKATPRKISYNVLRRSGIAIIFGLDKNIYQLILDDFPRARFYASASTLIEFFGERSLLGTNKKMFSYIHENEMTLYAFDQGRLLFVNTFNVHETADCQYYILNVWKQLGMDQIDDALFIITDNEKRKDLSEKIQLFLKSVSVIDRKDDFRHTLTKGDAFMPYDLQTLLVCGF